MACKTRSARLRRAIGSVEGWCRRHRHLPIQEQRAMLARKLVGHYGYFGVNGNRRSLTVLWEAAKRSWQKWLNRRSQRKSMTWSAFNRLLARFQVPPPRIVEKNNPRVPCPQELSFCQKLLEGQWPQVNLSAHARAS